MADDRIHYEVLVQDALRDVIRKVLTNVAKNGLVGEHHFFITFSTTHPGILMSHRLSQSYPDQMTIILQHQFWDLQVEQDHFSVALSFGNCTEKLVIPFSSLQIFYDPIAAFEVAFDMPSNQNELHSLPPEIENATAQSAHFPSQKPAPPLATTQTPNKASADIVSLDAFRKNK